MQWAIRVDSERNQEELSMKASTSSIYHSRGTRIVPLESSVSIFQTHSRRIWKFYIPMMSLGIGNIACLIVYLSNFFPRLWCFMEITCKDTTGWSYYISLLLCNVNLGSFLRIDYLPRILFYRINHSVDTEYTGLLSSDRVDELTFKRQQVRKRVCVLVAILSVALHEQRNLF